MKTLRWTLYAVLALLVVAVLLPVMLGRLPSGWLGERAAGIASDALGVPVDIDGLSLDLLSGTPSAAFDGVTVQDPSGSKGSEPLVEGVDGRVAIDAGALLGGGLAFDDVALSDGTLRLSRDADGEWNVAPLLERLAGGTDATGAESRSDAAPAPPAIRRLSVDDLRLELDDASTATRARVSVEASGSTTDPTDPLRAEIEGALASGGGRDVPISASLLVVSGSQLSEGVGALAFDASVALDGLTLSADGTLADPGDLDSLRFDTAITGDNLRPIEVLLGDALPAVPAFDFRSAVRLADQEIILRRFDLELGDSVLEGDVRLTPTTTPMTLYANLIFTRLDLDEILAIALGDGVPTASADETADDVITGGAGWFPDTELPLDTIAALFDGALRVRAETIDSRWPLDAANASLSLQDNSILVAPLRVSLSGGEIRGSLAIDTDGELPRGQVELRLRRIGLERVLNTFELPAEGAGTLGGRMRYWFEGDDIAEFAASADGGAFLLMTDGELQALLSELGGIDVVESTLLLLDPGRTMTAIDCAYADVLVERGVIDVNRVVIDTADTVFIADGRVDLGEETFSLSAEPHAKDISLMSGQSSVTIESDGSGIAVRPGGELLARAGLAAALAAVAAPAAALLPFVQAGLGEDSPYCDGLIEDMNSAR